MVGDIHDALDLGDRFQNRDLDALRERGRSHPAALATPGETEVRDAPLDRDEIRAAAVRCDRGIDLLLEYCDDPLRDRAREVGFGHVGPASLGRQRLVRVLHDHAARGEVELGPEKMLDAVGPEDDREIVVALHNVAVAGVRQRAQLHGVGKGAGLLSGDLDPQAKRIWVGLGRPHLQDLLPRRVGDLEDGLHQLVHVAMIRGVSRVLLLVPSATYRAADFVAAAKAIGAEIVVASDVAPVIPDATGTRSIAVPLDDPEVAAAQIVELDGRRGVDAVVALDDRGVLVAAQAARRLGLAHNRPEAVERTRDKEAMREALAAGEVPQPRFAAFDDPAEVGGLLPHLGDGPWVLKPVGLSASQGVIRADDAAGALAAAERTQGIAGGGRLLVEEYVDGTEVALEGLLRDGALEVLAVFDKPDAMEGPYFEETIYVTPSRLPAAISAGISRVVSDACAALGLTEGPVHAELRTDGTRVWIIEVAARSIGGLCGRALRFGAGISLEEVILRHALGMTLDGLKRERAASGVMMIPIPRAGTLEEVRGREEALAVPGIVGLEITVPPGRALLPLPEGDRYLGFLFARAATAAEVETALRAAHATLTVSITVSITGTTA